MGVVVIQYGKDAGMASGGVFGHYRGGWSCGLLSVGNFIRKYPGVVIENL